MMKKYFDPETGSEFIVGYADEVKAVYKSICRNSTMLDPYYFNSFPKFREGRIYGIELFSEEGEDNNFIKVVNANTLMTLILNDWIYEVRAWNVM